MTQFSDICAVILTKGGVDLRPILDTLPYGEVIVRFPEHTAVIKSDTQNVGRKHYWYHRDEKIIGRYWATAMSSKEHFYFQDDDVLFHEHDALLYAYDDRAPGTWVANTQPGLDDAQGYFDLALTGCGSLVPNGMWASAFKRYMDAHPYDDRFNLDADFIFGALSSWQKVDLGLEVTPLASDPDRLSQQPGQMEGKHRSINNARALRTVVLTMLTLNEQENVVRALASARPLYDRVLVHDTGSTDQTLKEIRNWCLANFVEYRIVTDVPFEGFGPNRQRLLDDARTEADFILLMDADEEMVGSVARPTLFADCYLFHYDGPFDYAQPRLLYANFPWRWSDAKRHAAINWTAYDGRGPIGCDVRGMFVRHHGTENSTPERYIADIEGLTDDIRAGRDKARSHFMRGKANEGLAEVTGIDGYWNDAANDYAARIEFGIHDEEGFYALFRLGCIQFEKLGLHKAGMHNLLSAYQARPTRAEPLRALAEYATRLADALPYPEDDGIIIHRESYKTQE